MKVKIKKLTLGAVVPTYATLGAGCFDISYSGVSKRHIFNTPVALETGLAFEIPEGFVMLIFSRSGHGFSLGVRLANCTGIIDSDYRGELLVKLHPDVHNMNPIVIEQGDKIAQGMIVPRPKVSFDEALELSITKRGEGGFGHTGK